MRTPMPKGRVRLQPALVLGALTIVAAPRPAEPSATAAGFAVKYRNVISPDRVRTLTALPGETVTLEVVRDPGSGYVARRPAGSCPWARDCGHGRRPPRQVSIPSRWLPQTAATRSRSRRSSSSRTTGSEIGRAHV